MFHAGRHPTTLLTGLHEIVGTDVSHAGPHPTTLLIGLQEGVGTDVSHAGRHPTTLLSGLHEGVGTDVSHAGPHPTTLLTPLNGLQEGVMVLGFQRHRVTSGLKEGHRRAPWYNQRHCSISAVTYRTTLLTLVCRRSMLFPTRPHYSHHLMVCRKELWFLDFNVTGSPPDWRRECGDRRVPCWRPPYHRKVWGQMCPILVYNQRHCSISALTYPTTLLVTGWL